jgi:hypothetical protein
MKLHFLPPVEDGSKGIWAEFADHWFANEYANNLTEELVIVFPQADFNDCTLDSSRDSCWNEIYCAWYQIKNSLPGTQLQAWRVIYKYGDEIAPNLSVFRLRNSKTPCLFWLCSKQNFIETQARLADLLPKISAYCHITQGRGLFHAAGILHKNQAYLFAGASGAGKSTVSSLSSAQGDKIIHDDHVVIYRGETGKWLVSDTAYSLQDAPVKVFLFLVQDHKDQLLPIKPAVTVIRLLESLREHGSQVLFGDVLRQAFATLADIARHVPGYELHFRKSPDFWKLIDEQFPD